jgi:hypothetical protein
MLNIQMTDCRAKEAESLERAEQCDDEDLRHLYKTIAKQWHLLAEQAGPRQASAVEADCAAALIAVSKIDALSETTEAPCAASLSDQILKVDFRTLQISSDAADEQAGADAESHGDQIRETERNVTQVSADLERVEACQDPNSESTDRTAQAGSDDVVSDNIQSTGELSPESGRIESPLEWFLSCWFRGARD